MMDGEACDEEEIPTPAEGEAEIPAHYDTLAHGMLSPKHRRLAFLAAQGKSNKEIKDELGYSDSRISILRRNPHIAAEINRLTERIYEETIGGRLKSFAEPALAVLERALTDRTNRVKESEKIDVAKWVLEKLDGKAAQKIEAGENLLAALMDRLDAAKTRPVLNITNNFHNEGKAIDVTPSPAGLAIEAPKGEEDLLADWVTDFHEGKL